VQAGFCQERFSSFQQTTVSAASFCNLLTLFTVANVCENATRVAEAHSSLDHFSYACAANHHCQLRHEAQVRPTAFSNGKHTMHFTCDIFDNIVIPWSRCFACTPPLRAKHNVYGRTTRNVYGLTRLAYIDAQIVTALTFRPHASQIVCLRRANSRTLWHPLIRKAAVHAGLGILRLFSFAIFSH
jgi:hypothetical protein